MIFSLLLALAYIIKYWSYNAPPLYDIISPLINITMGLQLLIIFPLSTKLIIVIISLLLDASADYLMDIDRVNLPVLLFTTGHLIKHTLLSHINLITIVLYLLLIVIIIRKYHINVLLIYAAILASGLIDSILDHSINLGMYLFIISDLIIVGDLFYNIYPRQIRIILVPLLYWLSEYLLATKIME